MRYCFVPFGMIKTKKIDNNKCKEVEELKLSYTECINMKWYSHFGKTVWQFLEVLHMPTAQFSRPTPIYLPKRKESMCLYKDLYMFITALFVICQNCKQSKCPSRSEWIN